MVLGVAFTFIFWALIICFIISLIKALINPATRKKALIEVGIMALLVAVAFGLAVYSLGKSMKWQERHYDPSSPSYVTNQVLCKPVVDVIEVYYVLPAFRDSDYWYQSGWYESIEDLADGMSLDDEQKEEFINRINNASPTDKFGSDDLYAIPANGDRDVLFYKVNMSEILGECSDGWRLGYFVIVDRNSSEVSIAAYYMET